MKIDHRAAEGAELSQVADSTPGVSEQREDMKNSCLTASLWYFHRNTLQTFHFDRCVNFCRKRRIWRLFIMFKYLLKMTFWRFVANLYYSLLLYVDLQEEGRNTFLLCLRGNQLVTAVSPVIAVNVC